jgi:NADH-quinone oxidoreductase subunit N
VLAVAAVMLSLIGAFYYLRVVKTMYFDEPDTDAPLPAGAGDARALLALNGAAVLGFGLLPGGLMSACADAIRLALAS